MTDSLNIATTNKPLDRIIGWDLLRGCCAYGVAIYHLLAWQKITELHTLGFYGVYLFFVISGASLTVTYYGSFTKVFSLPIFLNFIAVRYMRLAPLFVILVLLSFVWKLKIHGFNADLANKFIANVTFTFGFGTPLTKSIVVGGWSLGIEFVFYLLFPLFIGLIAIGKTGLLITAFGLAVLVQFSWIASTAAIDSVSLSSLTAYHQVPAFVAYFFGGCIIGWLQLHRLWAYPISAFAAMVAIAVFATVLVLLNHPAPEDILFGWRSAILFASCFGLVWWCGQAHFGTRSALWASRLGDVTYGVYLMHPFLFFGLSWLLLPRLASFGKPSSSSVDVWIVMATVLIGCTMLAFFSEKKFERPIRQRSRQWLISKYK